MYNVGELIERVDYLEALLESVEAATPPPLLRDVKIKITSRCNLRCVMCKYWQTTREETLSSERWRAAFREMAGLGCRKIHFSGGEVFLRRDFLDLVEDARGLGLKVNMTTNGTLVDKPAAKRMVAIGVNAVSISLDGSRSRVHDAIRGRENAFRKSLRTIRWIRDAGGKTKVRINFVVMRENVRELPAMVRLAAEVGAEELVPMPVDEKGERKKRLSRSEIRAYNREIAPEVEELRARFGFSTDPLLVYPFGVTEDEIDASSRALYARGFFERKSCLAPWLHLFAAWNGDVFLCCMTNGRMEPLGNLGLESAPEIFRGERYRRIREEFRAGRHLPPCARCDLFLGENARLHDALDRTREDAAGSRDPRPA